MLRFMYKHENITLFNKYYAVNSIRLCIRGLAFLGKGSTRFTSIFFFSFVTRKSAKQQACVKETLQNLMRSLNIQWDGTSKCSLGLDWDPKTEIPQCQTTDHTQTTLVRQKMFAGWGKKGENLEGVN